MKYLDREVSTNSSWGRSSRIGLTKHDTASLDNVETFPNHGDYGTGIHVLDKTREKTFPFEVSVVLLEMFHGSLKKRYDFSGTYIQQQLYSIGKPMSEALIFALNN